MTDNTYPDLTYLSPLTGAYVKSLLQPYHDALMAADSKESLIPWVRDVVPAHAEELIDQMTDLSLEETKLYILQHLLFYLDAEEGRSAWDINEYRDDEAARLFGPSGKTLPVIVTIGGADFVHELTEELTYGLLVGLSDTLGITISMFGVPLDRNQPEFDPIHVVIDQDQTSERFVVDHGNESIVFTTPDFVQGIITAAQWTNSDPHTIITNLRQVDGNFVETPLNF